MTFYEILEVAPSASFLEIRSSYRRLVKTYHPDLNPSTYAAEKIVKITEAYEVLSDTYQRQQYDWKIQYGYSGASEMVTPVPDKREQWRQDYIRRKRAKEQKNWEQLFSLKVKFYKAQRFSSIIFLMVALVYSYDYFYTQQGEAIEIDRIGLDRFGGTRIQLGYQTYYAERQFYYDYRQSPNQEVHLHYSRLHKIPVRISLRDNDHYTLNGTLHTFHNFFSYLIGAIGFILLICHKYEDWLLTLGLVPYFIVPFLLMTTYSTMAGG